MSEHLDRLIVEVKDGKYSFEIHEGDYGVYVKRRGGAEAVVVANCWEPIHAMMAELKAARECLEDNNFYIDDDGYWEHS